MSISPASDIVLDVARAADPQRLQAAAKRLESIAVGDTGADFSAALRTSAIAAPPRAFSSGASSLAMRTGGLAAGHGAGTLDPYQSLGGLVLQQAIEKMMPAPSQTMFGVGAGGSFWKSALAEHLANALAASVFKIPPGDGSARHTALQAAVSSGGAAV